MRHCDHCGKEIRFNIVLAFRANVTYYFCCIRHKLAFMGEKPC